MYSCTPYYSSFITLLSVVRVYSSRRRRSGVRPSRPVREFVFVCNCVQFEPEGERTVHSHNRSSNSNLLSQLKATYSVHSGQKGLLSRSHSAPQKRSPPEPAFAHPCRAGRARRLLHTSIGSPRSIRRASYYR